MKVRYIGEESKIGSRATFAFRRTWNIGEWVDVYEGLGDAYWSEFGAKISNHPSFDVEGGEPKVEGEAAVEEASADAPAPVRAPRKKKTT